ncbi:MAG: hypothetical protein U1E45_18595 [Geminicoccaceae bacterium]
MIIVGNMRQRYMPQVPHDRRHVFVHAKDGVLDAARRVKEELRPGDVVLVKGRDNERLDRVALALLGRDVRCAIDFCKLRSGRCEGCSHLETGWSVL